MAAVPGVTSCIMNEPADGHQDKPTVFQAVMRGLACRCPRCGMGKLYSGFLDLRPSCEVCGLDYAFIDAGDGHRIRCHIPVQDLRTLQSAPHEG